MGRDRGDSTFIDEEQLRELYGDDDEYVSLAFKHQKDNIARVTPNLSIEYQQQEGRTNSS